MPNAVFSCPKCKRLLGDIPAKGGLTVVCAKCRLKYEVVRGRVTNVDSSLLMIRDSRSGRTDPAARDYALRVELPNGAIEMVSVELPHADARDIAFPGDILTAVYLMRGSNREQLLSLHNATLGRAFGISVPGDKATSKAWAFGAAAGVMTAVMAASADASPLGIILAGTAVMVGLGVALGYRFMPRAEVSSVDEAQLTVTQKLLSEKINLETARAETVRRLQARGEMRERLTSLREKMLNVGLEIYVPRIAALNAALATIDQQHSLEARLREGYERSIQMIEIELESGAAATALDAAAPHIEATLSEMRDLEEQQAELGRQLAANAEVEGLLRGAS